MGRQARNPNRHGVRACRTDHGRHGLRSAHGELASAVAAQTEALIALEGALAHLDTLRARARWALEFGGIALTPSGGPAHPET